MKETGIIMSGNHPKLILNGTKTMTRRVIKPQPFKCLYCGDLVFRNKGGFYPHRSDMKNGGCPYGQVGDRLWVRETVKIQDFGDSKGVVAFKTTTNPDPSIEQLKWTPSIFMPRWASRITLEITEVRVERLQEIIGKDVWAEGIEPRPLTDITYVGDAVLFARQDFIKLWDSLNAKRGYGWEVNPWVFVISFKLVSQ